MINALQVTGQKKEQKLYRRHSGYTGNLKTTVLKDMMQKKPTEVGLDSQHLPLPYISRSRVHNCAFAPALSSLLCHPAKYISDARGYRDGLSAGNAVSGAWYAA